MNGYFLLSYFFFFFFVFAVIVELGDSQPWLIKRLTGKSFNSRSVLIGLRGESHLPVEHLLLDDLMLSS